MVSGRFGSWARSVMVASPTRPDNRQPSMAVSPPANNPHTVDVHRRRDTGAPRGPLSPGGRWYSFTTVLQGGCPLLWGNENQGLRSAIIAVHPVPAAAIGPPVLRRPKRRGTAGNRRQYRPRAACRGHCGRAVCENGGLASMASDVAAAVSSTVDTDRVACRRLAHGHRAGCSRRSARRIGRRQRLRKC